MAGARSKEFADPFSGTTNKRNANGSGEGVLYGTDTSGLEAEVRVVNSMGKENINISQIR
jgi:hypothetical protein